MTDEQLQRIHDIEYSCDSREELAERIVGLENESATLVIKLNAEHIARQNVEIENAKLREHVAELEELLPDSGRWYRAETVEAYVAEIAKLRELVREMHATISDRNSWWDCTYKDTRRFADRMCELGIEVG